MRSCCRVLLYLVAVLVGSGSAVAAEGDPFVSAAVEKQSYLLVEFTSESCPACDEMRPIVDKVLSDHPGVLYQEIDADLKPVLAKRYQVKCVPVYVIVDPTGTIRFNQVGMRTEEEMADILKEAGAVSN